MCLAQMWRMYSFDHTVLLLTSTVSALAPVMCESIRNSVDLLILGAGWTSTFLIPLCLLRGVSYVATSRAASPKPDTIVFDFDPTSDDSKPFAVLPNARTVLITFPIKLTGASEKLVNLYERTHPNMNPGYIQLGSTGIWRVSCCVAIRLTGRVIQTSLSGSFGNLGRPPFTNRGAKRQGCGRGRITRSLIQI